MRPSGDCGGRGEAHFKGGPRAPGLTPPSPPADSWPGLSAHRLSPVHMGAPEEHPHSPGPCRTPAWVHFPAPGSSGIRRGGQEAVYLPKRAPLEPEMGPSRGAESGRVARTVADSVIGVGMVGEVGVFRNSPFTSYRTECEPTDRENRESIPPCPPSPPVRPSAGAGVSARRCPVERLAESSNPRRLPLRLPLAHVGALA